MLDALKLMRLKVHCQWNFFACHCPMLFLADFHMGWPKMLTRCRSSTCAQLSASRVSRLGCDLPSKHCSGIDRGYRNHFVRCVNRQHACGIQPSLSFFVGLNRPSSGTPLLLVPGKLLVLMSSVLTFLEGYFVSSPSKQFQDGILEPAVK